MKHLALVVGCWLLLSSALPAQAGQTNIVFLVGENEYGTENTLAEFAKKELEPLGFLCHFSQAPAEGGNEFTNTAAIKSADLLVVSVRRRTPRKEVIESIRQHIQARKPLVGIRTASHAFDATPPDEEHSAWPTFDVDVLGAKYGNHYGNKPPQGPATSIKPVVENSRHPVLTGISGEPFQVTSHLYKYRNLVSTATPLLSGTIEGRKETEPVAWANTGHNRRVFYTSLGSQEDFRLLSFQRLLLNGMLWSLSLPIPTTSQTEPGKSRALPPTESLSLFRVPEDLDIEQVLTEPLIAQPVFLNFDERGRMWVVQYRQYPFPAGLKMMSRDQYWRAVYDKTPEPPPHHIPGRDRISIHEDTDGDGKFDKHTVFVDGLNIATAVARGRGGVWVLNPPYLLFYPDANNDDKPDGDPVVHLAGFGLEDTHSVVNSLCWGPDGWLYAAQGSTVTGNITRPGLDKEPVRSMGQLIWRYHPETHRYEIFAEGGGNAFGVEVDSKGRIFSGHNGGNTRGFHYVQGGYLQKGFSKHGPLSNPYAFGYFPAMAHPDVERFTHTFVIYEGVALPNRFHGKLLGVEPLQGRVVESEFLPSGSSFKTRDLSHPMTTSDSWFRPVDIKVGPDGAVYVADWYDGQVNHYRNHEGQVDPSTGRIYRLKAKGTILKAPSDLAKLSTDDLITLLNHTNKWQRQTALRLLGDRKEGASIPKLVHLVQNSTGQSALEAFWALHLVGGFNEETAERTLQHKDPYVRLWTVRLLADKKQISPALAIKIANMATIEPNIEVRSQVASSARRLPAGEALPIVRALLSRAEDIKDIHIPLLIWWAIESKADSDREAILSLLDDKQIWNFPMVRDHILQRIMRRYAMAGTQKDLLICLRLLQLAPDSGAKGLLIAGFEEAFQGRPLIGLPDELTLALASHSSASLTLRVRLGQPDALKRALDSLSDESVPRKERLQLIKTFGEIKHSASVPVLLQVLSQSKDQTFRKAALTALQAYDDPKIGAAIIQGLQSWPESVRTTAQSVLASRSSWALHWLQTVNRGELPKETVPSAYLKRLETHHNREIQALVDKHWPIAKRGASTDLETRIDRLTKAVQADFGDPYVGKKLYESSCAACHKLFDQGGQVGPDLTIYQRDNIGNMLLNVLNPNAEIREGFENFLVTTKDGRSLSGFLADQNNRMVVLRGIDGQNIVLARDEIATMQAAGISLMPEGLLDGLSEIQVRDLFAYLRSTQPLNDGN